MTLAFWALAGLAVGAIGTLIGAGGGFLLVPLLLFVEPALAPRVITAISLAVVSANAISGTIVYVAKRRVVWGAALLFAACSLPGVALGVFVNTRASTQSFLILFAVLIGALAIFTLRRANASHDQRALPVMTPALYTKGAIASGVIAVAATFLGIGGGLLHVPFLVYALRFPPHAATATSHATLAITASFATVLHVYAGDLQGEGARILALSVGVVIGAQVGASLSMRVKGVVIMRMLAIALLLLASRLTWISLNH